MIQNSGGHISHDSTSSKFTCKILIVFFEISITLDGQLRSCYTGQYRNGAENCGTKHHTDIRM